MSLSDFELGKVLGKGAFGTVCLVKRKEDQKTYAMKRVKIAQMSSKEKDNALNEIRLLASLSHPNIIAYHEAFFDESSQTLNIVMEYADDGDIEQKIKDNQRRHLSFQESTIWIWLIQILQGLKYLHDNKIMHRDLKCANLFLTKKGVLKLGDLNVSKLARLGMAATQTGTPYYASPEVWLDKPYDYKSDLWSVGCIIYETCSLKPPFRGTSLKNLFENVKRGVYPPIPSMYSRDLSKIISMMLIVDPRNRVSTDALLNCDIIQREFKIYKNQMNEEIIAGGNHLNDQAVFIKTIKMPKLLKEINKQLPKKRYQKKNKEKEMMENDEYETQKANFFKELSKEKRNNVKPITSDNQVRNINNNDIRDYKIGQQKQIIPQGNPYKYNYLNNYDNNMRRIPEDNNEDIDKGKNNNIEKLFVNKRYDYGSNNNNKYNNYQIAEKDVDEERQKIYEKYLQNKQKAQQLMINKYPNKINDLYQKHSPILKKQNSPYQDYIGVNKINDSNKNHNNDYIKPNDPYQRYNKGVNKPSDPYQNNNRNLNKLNDLYNQNYNINYGNNQIYNEKINPNQNIKYKINKPEKAANYQKEQRPIQGSSNDKQGRYRMLFNNEDTIEKPIIRIPKINKNEVGLPRHLYNSPPLKNNRPITAKDPQSNILDKKYNLLPNYYGPNQIKIQQYQSPLKLNEYLYNRLPGKPNRPFSAAPYNNNNNNYGRIKRNNPSKKIVYEKIDYNNYMAKRQNNPQGNGNVNYNQNKILVDNQNNLYHAQGQKVVVHRKKY